MKKYLEYKAERLNNESLKRVSGSLAKELSVLTFFFSLMASSVLLEREAFSEDYSRNEALIGSLRVLIEAEDGSSGQGYIAFHDGSLRIYTIDHVISSSSVLTVSIQNFKEDAKIKSEDFDCEIADQVEGVDNDTACFYEFSEKAKAKLIEKKAILPLIRKKVHEGLKEGAYIGFLGQGESNISVLRVKKIDENYIYVESVLVKTDESGAGVYKGAICQGNSGAAAVLLSVEEGNYDAVYPVYSDEGGGIAVGEIESGNSKIFFNNESDPEAKCFIEGRIRRPLK